jgi:hypothetical protein
MAMFAGNAQAAQGVRQPPPGSGFRALLIDGARPAMAGGSGLEAYIPVTGPDILQATVGGTRWAQLICNVPLTCLNRPVPSVM